VLCGSPSCDICGRELNRALIGDHGVANAVHIDDDHADRADTRRAVRLV
jgi:hypothetical protein